MAAGEVAVHRDPQQSAVRVAVDLIPEIEQNPGGTCSGLERLDHPVLLGDERAPTRRESHRRGRVEAGDERLLLESGGVARGERGSGAGAADGGENRAEGGESCEVHW